MRCGAAYVALPAQQIEAVQAVASPNVSLSGLYLWVLFAAWVVGGHHGLEVPLGGIGLQSLDLANRADGILKRGPHMLDRGMSLVRIIGVVDEVQRALEKLSDVENWRVGHRRSLRMDAGRKQAAAFTSVSTTPEASQGASIREWVRWRWKQIGEGVQQELRVDGFSKHIDIMPVSYRFLQKLGGFLSAGYEDDAAVRGELEKSERGLDAVHAAVHHHIEDGDIGPEGHGTGDCIFAGVNADGIIAFHV